MNFEIAIAFSLSVTLAAIIGWARLPKIGPAFLPFILLLTLATITEFANLLLVKIYKNNAPAHNIYTLLESLLITWQFHRWKQFQNKQFFYFIISSLIASWLIEIVFLKGLFQFNSYFIVLESVLVFLLSITIINRLVKSGYLRPFRTSIFIIAACFIIFYTFSALIEIYWIWGLNASSSFRLNISRIFIYINLFTNLAYAIAILWIPRKREFIQLS